MRLAGSMIAPSRGLLISRIRLDGEVDAALFSDRERPVDGCEHLFPGLVELVIGMVGPDVIQIARAGAEGERRNTEALRGFRKNAKPFGAAVAHGGVRVRHVVRR